MKKENKTTPNRTEKEVIASQMADYFAKNIKSEMLLKWISEVMHYSDRKSNINLFAADLAADFIPGLNKCKNLKSVLGYAKKWLPIIFSGILYNNLKTGFSDLLLSFMEEYKIRRGYEFMLSDFFETTKQLMLLNEFYGEYELLQKEGYNNQSVNELN